MNPGFDRKTFYKKLLLLSLPVMLQNFIVSSFQLLDTVMIGQLGEAEIAGVGLANQVFFVFILILFGISSGASVFTAQFWGKKDTANIRHITGICSILTVSLGLIFAMAGFFIPRQLIGLYSRDPEVITYGAQYLRIVCLGYPFLALSFSWSVLLRSVEKTIPPLIVSVVSLVFNGFFNFVLIFGKFGFPAMGVKGAALATAASRVLEIVLGLILLKSIPNPLLGPLKEYFTISKEQLIRVLKMMAPVILNETIWGLGITTYNAIFARVGTETIAAFRIAATVMDLFFVIFLGMGNACATMVGKAIGEGRKDLAYNHAGRFLKLSILVGAVVGIGVFFTAAPVTRLYNVSQTVRDLCRNVLIVYSIALIFKSSTLHLVVGIFRSGGDALMGMLMDLVGVWGIGIPLALLGCFVFHWDLPAVYALICVEEAIKLVYGIFRLRSRKWITDVTEPPPELSRLEI